WAAGSGAHTSACRRGAVRRGTKHSVAGTAAQGCACVRTFVSVRSDLRVRHCRGDSRLDRLDTQVQGAAQSAESANQGAQCANQRLDQIEGRVQRLESSPRRVPRG
ncbi:hypothetical protein, partial [Enterobacter hormaechei]|uniref:hypothetical protein n=1 Tax=Enterobacter hormaechei TaxID=158836 RepID=UPI002147226C